MAGKTIFSEKDPFPTEEEMRAETEMPGYHTHCVRCRQSYCTQTVDDVTCCPMTVCAACSFQFHLCKEQQHRLICQEEKVPCVNANYGCPHLVRRAALALHLPVCPASVVTCKEYWKRQRMHSAEKGVEYPLPATKTYLDCGQLDVALAMRDQRTLIYSWKAPTPKKRTHSVRNHLNHKNPLTTQRGTSLESDCSIESSATSQTVSVSDDDTEDAPRYPSGSHMYQVSKEASDDLISKLHVQGQQTSHDDLMKLNAPQDSSVDNNSIPEPGGEKEISPARSLKIKSDRSSADRGEGDSDRSDRSSRSVSVLRDDGGSQLHRILGVKLGGGDGAEQQQKTEEIKLHQVLGVSLTEFVRGRIIPFSSTYTFMCAQHFRRDQYKWHFKNVHNDIQPQADHYMEHRCPLAYQGCNFSYRRLVPSNKNTELHFSPLLESFGLKSTEEMPFNNFNKTVTVTKPGADKDTSSSRKTSSSSGCDVNDPDLSDLKITQTEKKINNTAEEPSVSLSKEGSVSVKPVLYTSLNADSNILLVYNVQQEEEEMCEAESTNNKNNMGLLDLPFEVLLQIAGHLDSFSLCNVSLTCQRLREFCCSMLDDSGIVLFDWCSQENGDKISWQVESKSWRFSTSFEPITKWTLNDDHLSMTQHLRDCSYNKNTVDHSQAIQLPLTQSQIQKDLESCKYNANSALIKKLKSQ